MRSEQESSLRFIAGHGSSVHELWTGVGKTEIATTLAKTAAKHFQKCVVTVPTKTIADQYRERFPDVFTVAFGRSDFLCFLYERDKTNLTRESKTKFTADEIPHTICRVCPHFVDQETGKVQEKGALACPYYLQNHQAKVSRKPVLTTFAFYLFKRLFSKDFPEPDLLVIDEGHRVPELVRSALSYDITDWHLEQAISILEKVEEHETAAALEHFRKRMIEIVRKKHRILLDAEEISALIKILETIDGGALSRSIAKAIKSDAIEAEDNLEIFKKVEGVALNLRRYIRSLEFSLPLANRGALAYTYAYHEKEETKDKRVINKLVVCSHYVAALVKKCLLGKTTVALSATIGDSEIFGQESGIQFPFLSLPPSFPPENTAVYMPTDTPNLAFKEQKHGTVTNVMRRMARATKKLARQGIHSLHVVVANKEREKLVALMEEEGVKAVSYGNGVTAREAALRFREGEGDCLVGTSANFSEGIDLPKQIAPAIFALRPPYMPMYEPRSMFEEQRYGSRRWAIWNWRVQLFVLQVRGRNIRRVDDLGVVFFISQQFRRIVFSALPKTLQVAYKGDLTLDQCVKEALALVR
ncbi:MAG: hypothetical protein A3C08_02725 [Candidatus Taylorbacteria bacterium RIFCSPHIGHO2_02_FULL_47_18]|uniref:Helicase ATP-binding domain-containing protein n=1 Tax=Candidatus Taylorbacteria bacterium RIFCSPLOWO2_01_FULL_48_100 TaxID=1802322 RepID=A0A1G2NE03_9BACT|nr:MAG: hypothetical protein A2670_02435 [Candidatus Taylorbacteria bacterium RIFCSPHIGHO2_01_FULL_48_38]OHA27614.1 MAG: hypothetical protein A3C08_02725 [Candidatus Taylorbacteria bacterium RIFCSPHIGHO2_02_FULL_47_18]OHA34306.1 MAG: hypothetical protein A2938_02110 [Candidatus Taylorbacteria bacterium RIFCSPLOWO2_01_FULL_48_100]OHA40460.1 MAG: hypothetical protein A3J31_02745 [Candidatus Taylorbacteria bacterium RIFCSPLOWO2_02_FULL_48_16]OHA44900.1 MAG: hypothetical protein A3H13_03280 [Candid